MAMQANLNVYFFLYFLAILSGKIIAISQRITNICQKFFQILSVIVISIYFNIFHFRWNPRYIFQWLFYNTFTVDKSSHRCMALQHYNNKNALTVHIVILLSSIRRFILQFTCRAYRSSKHDIAIIPRTSFSFT